MRGLRLTVSRKLLIRISHPETVTDPIFFLHHAQLDRLWWRWQQLKPNTRFVEYTGQHMVNSSGNASLSDRLFVDTLAVDNAVGDVMSIQGKILCYDYI